MSEADPIQLSPRAAAAPGHAAPAQSHAPPVVAFNRQELGQILSVYGRKVAAGEWRDYSIEFCRDWASFSVYRRTSEVPLYRIEKTPKLARKQGAYAVVAATGLILKRGHELPRVLDVLEKRVRLVET